MEINITEFFNKADHIDYSASMIERGNNVATLTWNAAVTDAPRFNMLDTQEKVDAFRDYVAGYGAWSSEEINGWSPVECNALFMQFVAGDIREAEHVTNTCAGPDFDWKAVENEAERGRIGGRFFKGSDGQIYYSIMD